MDRILRNARLVLSPAGSYRLIGTDDDTGEPVNAAAWASNMGREAWEMAWTDQGAMFCLDGIKFR